MSTEPATAHALFPMTEIDLNPQLSKLLERHGLNSVNHNDWVAPNADLPAMRGTWFPGEKSGRLNIEVFLESEAIIGESFAGVGSGEAGLNDALTTFSITSLHVLLAALWNRPMPDQVVTEAWEVNGKRYTVYIGAVGTRGSLEAEPHVPHDLFSKIKRAFNNERLNNDIHWARLFFCNVAGEQIFEALLDNNVWQEGLQGLKSIDWPHSKGYYSVRQFLVLRAA